MKSKLKFFYFDTLTKLSWRTQKRFAFKTKFDKHYGTEHTRDESINNLIAKKIREGKPFMLARFGGVELKAALNVHDYYNNTNILKDSFLFLVNQKTKFWEVSPNSMDMIHINAGFFPKEINAVKRFQEKLFEDSKLLDILGISVGLEHLVPTVPQTVDFSYLRDLEPWWFTNPWSKELKDKKVLIIYPNSRLIQEQYRKRTELYINKEILPDFELITYEPVQSIAGIETNYKTWFDALDTMISDIKKIDFDVAIIGAGAYGFSLAAEIKKMGKQALQLGGVTQLFFGIKGKRWEDWKHYTDLRGSGWVESQDKPKGFENIEGGCYW